MAVNINAGTQRHENNPNENFAEVADQNTQQNPGSQLLLYGQPVAEESIESVWWHHRRTDCEEQTFLLCGLGTHDSPPLCFGLSFGA